MEETPWLDDEQLRAWKRFVAVVEQLPGILDSQLQQDSDLNHFEYYVLAMLSEAPGRTLRMTALAERTNATLPRLSHVVARLEKRGYIERERSAEDKRATNAVLTDAGWQKTVAAAPGHVRAVHDHVIAPLSREQIAQLDAIATAILGRIAPDRPLPEA